MGIWVCNFTDANLGPHHELQFSFFTSRGEIETSSHRLNLLKLMMNPEIQMLCHGLWNSTAEAVAYNRELLSLNSRIAKSRIKNDANLFEFEIEDGSNGEPVLSGRLANLNKPTFGASWDLLMRLGFMRIWKIARQPWVNLQILNPTGVVLGQNAA